MDVGTFFLLAAFSYAIGIFWYSLLPGHYHDHPWRVAAYPFAAMVLAEALAQANVFPGGPVLGGMHPVTALIAALIGCVVDWAIQAYRRPSVAPEMQPLAAQR